MNNVSEQIEALIRFKHAYTTLSFMWNGRKNGVNLNDTKAIVDYPFDMSFDELNVVHWVDRTVDELKGKTVMRHEEGLSLGELHKLKNIVRISKDDIDFMSVEEVERILQTLKCLEYNKSIKEFYNHLVDSMPDMPNSTDEEQEAFDKAWEKFYETPFTISFGGKTVRIDNEATIYQGIVDTLKEMIDYCL